MTTADGASGLTTLTLNTYRNARRSGLTLADTYRSIDKWIRAQFPGSFVTAVMAEFETRDGVYRRISAGHDTGACAGSLLTAGNAYTHKVEAFFLQQFDAT